MSSDSLHVMRQIVQQMQDRISYGTQPQANSRREYAEIPSSDASEMRTLQATRSTQPSYQGLLSLSRDSRPASRDRSVTPSPVVNGTSHQAHLDGSDIPHGRGTTQSPAVSFQGQEQISASPIPAIEFSSRAYDSLLHEKSVSKAILADARVILKSAKQLSADAIYLIQEARKELRTTSLEAESDWHQRQRKTQAKILAAEQLAKRRRVQEEAQHRKLLDDLFKETCQAAIKLKQVADEEFAKTTQRRRDVETESKAMMAKATSDLTRIQAESDRILAKAKERLDALRVEAESAQANLQKSKQEVVEASTRPPYRTIPLREPASHREPWQHATREASQQSTEMRDAHQQTAEQRDVHQQTTQQRDAHQQATEVRHMQQQTVNVREAQQQTDAKPGAGSATDERVSSGSTSDGVPEVLAEAQQALEAMHADVLCTATAAAASTTSTNAPAPQAASEPPSCCCVPQSVRIRRMQDGLLAWHLAVMRKRYLSYSLSRIISFPTLAATLNAADALHHPPPPSAADEAIARAHAVDDREGTVI